MSRKRADADDFEADDMMDDAADESPVENTEKPVEPAKPVKGAIGPREFLANSKEIRKYNQYVRVGFERKLSIDNLHAELKTADDWLEMFRDYAGL